jgi:hypothetical protein
MAPAACIPRDRRQTEVSEDFLENARILLKRRDLSAAIAAFNRGEAAGACADSCAGGRWMAHMLAGNFTAAWCESDAIRGRGAPDSHRFWAGEDLSGRRVILRCLHGYGDTVQFLRYAPRIRALASQLIVEVPPAMVELAPFFNGVDEVITWGSGAPAAAPPWDVQVEVTELPYLFRTEAKELPLAADYLHLPLQAKIGRSSAPRVGLVWASGDWDRERSIPYRLLQPLLQISECEFWNLQGGWAREESKVRLCCGEGVLALASAISQLDLVITVDTLAAHLAGAMGKPAWVLLQNAADWRWMTKRRDSLWYSSLRLFRQPSPGDWENTILAVQVELARWVVARAA